MSSQYFPESLKDTPSASSLLTLRNDALPSRVQNERGSLTCNSFRVFGPTLICPEASELGLKGRDFWNVRKNGSTRKWRPNRHISERRRRGEDERGYGVKRVKGRWGDFGALILTHLN